MSRFPLIAPDAATDATVVRVYREIESELGFGIVPNVFRAMGSMPRLLEANWNLFRATVLTGRLPRVVKEMVGVVVSYVHDSPYARDVHLHSLTVQGIDKDLLKVLARGDTPTRGLSPAHAAVLAFARVAAAGPSKVSAAVYATLDAAGLDPEDIMEVSATIECFTAINAFTDLGAVPLDAL